MRRSRCLVREPGHVVEVPNHLALFCRRVLKVFQLFQVQSKTFSRIIVEKLTKGDLLDIAPGNEATCAPSFFFRASSDSTPRHKHPVKSPKYLPGNSQNIF